MTSRTIRVIRGRVRAWNRGFVAPLSLVGLGVLAVVAAAILAAISFAVFGAEMGPHLAATIIGILGEAALVVLVLDRMARWQERKDWHFVKTIVCQGIAACMVDVVRLCGIRWSPDAYKANMARYGEFAETLQLHIADLRSSLEGLALAAEPSVYRQARLIERRIAWISGRLSQVPGRPAPDHEYPMIVDTIKRAGQLLEESRSSDFMETVSKARRISAELGVLESPRGSRAAADRFWASRLRIQDEALRQRGRQYGIWYDIDQELAEIYFAIDYALFTQVRVPEAISHSSLQ